MVVAASATGAGTMAAISIGASPPNPALAPAGPSAGAVDPQVAASFGVFRRTRQKTDVAPAALEHSLQGELPQFGANFTLSRRATTSNGEAAYLVPSNSGVCVFAPQEGGCVSAATAAGGGIFGSDLCSPTLPAGQIELAWLLPDDATGVRAHLADGSHLNMPTGNVYVQRFSIQNPPKTIEWTARGANRSLNAGVPSDVGTMKCVHPGDLTPQQLAQIKQLQQRGPDSPTTPAPSTSIVTTAANAPK